MANISSPPLSAPCATQTPPTPATATSSKTSPSPAAPSRELADSRERLQFALDATEEGLWDWNSTTNHLIYSRGWFAQLGYAYGEFPDNIEAWQKICHPDDLGPATDYITKVLTSSSNLLEFEQRLRHKQGHYIWVYTRGKVVKRDENGRAIRVVGTNLDITKRKAAAAELLHAEEEAQAASKAKGQFLANMSHEIRTPLTAIIGYTDILQDPQTPPEKRSALIDTIRRNSNHLMTILNDILDLSKIEAGKMTVEKIPLLPTQIVSDITSLLHAPAPSKKASTSPSNIVPPSPRHPLRPHPPPPDPHQPHRQRHQVHRPRRRQHSRSTAPPPQKTPPTSPSKSSTPASA